MRLDDFDPNDINVGDQRGQGGGGFGFGGGGGGGGLLFGLLPLIGSRFGCGGIVVVLILLAVFGGLGNVGSLVSGGGGGTAVTSRAPSAGGADAVRQACTVDASSKAACNAFESAQRTWEAIFAAEGRQFQKPSLQFYAGNGQSGCGAAQSAMGPFYCPSDQGIYLDTSFFAELQSRFHASGDFAQDYVIAHEFGHHIQNLLGTSDQVTRAGASATGASGASVRLELQADCYAGVWASKNKDRMDASDLQEGLTAAHAIGDDTLQEESQGRVVPDSFTHGTSAQREHWLKRGYETGDPAQCDTFSGAV